MTTADQVLLIVLASLMSLFFLLMIAAAIIGIKLLNAARRVVEKADEVAASVSEAAEAFRGAQGKLAIFKLIRNIVKLAKRSHR